ncbi:2-hydroxyacid dehydrogenase [Alteromonas sp. ASW11-130]|uniref:2-hydroxyacid dehydrogenase n=1 Tax=Alteromonas sp. ASW11-130 TaxID=3015775 RepID=UPI002241B15D|nr:2-hydroxyacid dehydrogenase [Alteromonas sp. ASW11-130]MCW8091431.1 2-hydroxyacid dehydrogenase [Alteromonas sp. ASW11-130]
MKICVFSSKKYDKRFITEANSANYDMQFHAVRLSQDTAILAKGFDGVCCFVNDDINANVIAQLGDQGIRLIALRCAGFNNVDLEAAKAHHITVCRVPAYSPHAVAEHACALILDLNRNIHRAHNRIRENDYSLDGLLGFDLYKKAVGVIGAGNIGRKFINIMQGFGCNIIVSDPQYHPTGSHEPPRVELDKLLASSDLISLHCPLNSETHHLINKNAIAQMKAGVMLINTSRGGLVDTKAVIDGLKSGKIGYLGIDVYEEESTLFFENYSDTFIQDDIFARLQTFPNVTITGHQGFFTKEALEQIARTTMNNIAQFAKGNLKQVHVVVAS